MKWLTLFALLSVIGCEEKISKNLTKKEVSRDRLEPATEYHAKAYLSPRVSIDEAKREIIVTGHSGALCGIDFKDDDVMTYVLLNDETVDLELNGEFLTLHRIHQEGPEERTGIKGEWTAVIQREHETGSVYFDINDSGIMNVDVVCKSN